MSLFRSFLRPFCSSPLPPSSSKHLSSPRTHSRRSLGQPPHRHRTQRRSLHQIPSQKSRNRSQQPLMDYHCSSSGVLLKNVNSLTPTEPRSLQGSLQAHPSPSKTSTVDTPSHPQSPHPGTLAQTATSAPQTLTILYNHDFPLRCKAGHRHPKSPPHLVATSTKIAGLQ